MNYAPSVWNAVSWLFQNVYVEIFLTIVNGFQPVIFKTKRSILILLQSWIRLSILQKAALFRVTCIFKYFDLFDRSNLQTVMNEFLTDWNAVFMQKISKLHYSAILSSPNWKFFVVLDLNQIYWDFILCGIELVQENNERIYWKDRPYNA